MNKNISDYRELTNTICVKNILLALFFTLANINIPTCYSTYIIGFSGLPGSGKSTIARAVAEKLGAPYLGWDEFADTATQPENPIAWFNDGADCSKYKNPDFKTALRLLKEGKSTKNANGEILHPSIFVVVEVPLGRQHEETAKYIDKIFLMNTEPQIAYIRQVKRDNNSNKNVDMDLYNNVLKPMYTCKQIQQTGDIKINGKLRTIEQIQFVLKHISKKSNL